LSSPGSHEIATIFIIFASYLYKAVLALIAVVFAIQKESGKIFGPEMFANCSILRYDFISAIPVETGIKKGRNPK